jgi:prepilin-type N-terminal cleavage/methylation domain-containing protein
MRLRVTRASRPGRVGRRPLGFTLVEMLLALGVVAVLATIALPSLTEALHRTRRIEAAELGQVEIHHDHVGRQALRFFDGAQTILGLANDFHVRTHHQHGAQALAHDIGLGEINQRRMHAQAIREIPQILLLSKLQILVLQI